MNIAMISASLPSSGKKPGGVDIVIHRLANTLIKAGQSVVVLSPCNKPPGFRGRPAWFVQLWWLVQATLFRASPQVLYGWRRFGHAL